MADYTKDNPSYECKDFREMSLNWQVVKDVDRGTLHLRRQTGFKYLPMEPAEDEQDYKIRKGRAVLFNAFQRTLNGLVGMVFRKDPKFEDDVAESIAGKEAESEDEEKVEGLAENIDNQGTHWMVFAKELFTDAMRDGHAFVLVDMPPALPSGATFADERALGFRPYWTSFTADQAINWRIKPEMMRVPLETGEIGSFPTGRQILTQITFREVTYEDDGQYGEKEVVKYRVLRPGSWQIWRENLEYGSNERTFFLEDSGTTNLDEIPLCVVYARKEGMLKSLPPLLDLALINICHYQKYSDYSTYLHISSRPVLWFRGRNQAQVITAIGPYTAFDVTENGEVAFAETTGAALEAARLDLQDLEEQMAALGLSIIAGQAPQPDTATQELLDNIQEQSDLATAARSLKDCLERALYYTMLFLDPNAETGGSIKLGAAIEDLTLTAQDLSAYSNLVALKQLSLDTLWAILQRAGKLPENFDPEAEKKEIVKVAKMMNEVLLTAIDRDENLGGGEE